MRRAAYKRWSLTPDWTAATALARANGPAGLEWHARKLDPEGKLPTEQRMKQAEAARKLYYLDMADRSRKARAARKPAQGPPQAPAEGAA